METGIAKHEFEDSDLQGSTRYHGSTSACVAMVACNVMLLLMLAACSPPAHAQDLARQASGVDARTLSAAVRIETLTVAPSPEDVPPPVKDRWQRFDEALNAGRSRNHRVVESAAINGVRMACHEPCVVNCCETSGEFSLAGRGFGR
jgi:hypothetical protein